jgi:hypothetical protein
MINTPTEIFLLEGIPNYDYKSKKTVEEICNEKYKYKNKRFFIQTDPENPYETFDLGKFIDCKASSYKLKKNKLQTNRNFTPRKYKFIFQKHRHLHDIDLFPLRELICDDCSVGLGKRTKRNKKTKINKKKTKKQKFN